MPVSSTRAAFARDLAAPEIDRDVARGEPLDRRLGLDAPKDGAEAREQLARRERLGDVVVGAELETDDAVGLVALRGEHEHGHVALRADALADLEPVDARHHHVEEHGVDAALLEHRQPLLSVARALHRDAVLLEVAREQLEEPSVVVDEEHAHARHAYREFRVGRRNRRELVA